MTVALYANIILLLCVGVATECDTWNSDVENEQPQILINRVPSTIRYVLQYFSKTFLRKVGSCNYLKYVCKSVWICRCVLHRELPTDYGGFEKTLETIVRGF